MRSRRSHNQRRRPQNTTWQAVHYVKQFANIPAGRTNWLIDNLEPQGGGNDFTDQVVFERMRGVVCHIMKGTGTTVSPSVPITFAMFFLPAEVKNVGDADLPDLFESGEGDDYPVFHTSACNDRETLIPSIHVLDFKARRVVDPGSRMVFCASTDNTTGNLALDVDLTLNARILWKLR